MLQPLELELAIVERGEHGAELDHIAGAHGRFVDIAVEGAIAACWISGSNAVSAATRYSPLAKIKIAATIAIMSAPSLKPR